MAVGKHNAAYQLHSLLSLLVLDIVTQRCPYQWKLLQLGGLIQSR